MPALKQAWIPHVERGFFGVEEVDHGSLSMHYFQLSNSLRSQSRNCASQGSGTVHEVSTRGSVMHNVLISSRP